MMLWCPVSTAGFCVVALTPLCGRGVDYGDCLQDVGCFAAIDDRQVVRTAQLANYTPGQQIKLYFICSKEKKDR